MKAIVVTILGTAGGTIIFAILHSLLASLTAKQMAARKLGQRTRNGLYRPFFIAQSFITLAALLLFLRRLPDRTIYKAPRWAGIFLRLGQLAGLALAVAGAWRVGLGQISGWNSFREYIGGHYAVTEEPPAQGPSRDVTGRLQTGWPFSWTRHPLNLSPLPMFWLTPEITVKRLVFNLVASLYLVIGSVHEEHRLENRYQEVYRQYQKSGVPFYLPAPWRGDTFGDRKHE